MYKFLSIVLVLAVISAFGHASHSVRYSRFTKSGLSYTYPQERIDHVPGCKIYRWMGTASICEWCQAGSYYNGQECVSCRIHGSCWQPLLHIRKPDEEGRGGGCFGDLCPLAQKCLEEPSYEVCMHRSLRSRFYPLPITHATESAPMNWGFGRFMKRREEEVLDDKCLVKVHTTCTRCMAGYSLVENGDFFTDSYDFRFLHCVPNCDPTMSAEKCVKPIPWCKIHARMGQWCQLCNWNSGSAGTSNGSCTRPMRRPIDDITQQ